MGICHPERSRGIPFTRVKGFLRSSRDSVGMTKIMYEEHLTNKSIFFTRQTWWLLFLFFAIRILSYFLTGQIAIQAVIIFCLIMLLGILYFKNPDWALYLVLAEIFLGGGGHFFEFLGLSIRTLLIGFYLVLWFGDQLGRQIFWQKIKIHNSLQYLLLFFFIFLLINAGVGLYQGHSVKDVLQSFLPYSLLVLLFPSFHIFQNEKTQNFLVRNICVFIIGSALVSLFVFIIYSSGIGVLQDGFYHWYRDIALGKITDLGNGFFRVVEPEHLLIVPFILLIASLLMRDEKHHKMWRLLIFLASITLILNFSRGYFLALLVGFLVLKYKHKWHRWLIVSATTVGLMALIFISINLIASQGRSLGLELFGIRVLSLVQPQMEISAATRMMILPSILEIIKSHPLLGTGLGSSVTHFNELLYNQETTRQFDWGYLQMWVELGLFGFLTFLWIIFFTISSLIAKIRFYADYQEFDVGLLAGLVAFLTMNITSPALFHIFGIIFLILVITLTLKPANLVFGQLIDLLYRIFNRLKNV